MRIVHVIRSNAFAGVERHVIVLANAQAAIGHDVTVIGGDPGPMARERTVGVRHRRAVTTIGAMVEVLKSLSGSPDVVHAHMTAAESASAAALVGRSVPLVATRHFAFPRGRTPFARAIGALAGKRIDAEIAISHFVATRAAIDAAVVYPGVASQPERRSPPGMGRATLLVVQRLEPEKATDVAVRAFAASRLAQRGWRLDVVGDGSCRADLARLSESLGLGQSVRFLGSRTDVHDLMTLSDVFLAPCAVEGLGLAVLEAMAAGTPVVAARAGGHLETVGSLSTARLFTPGDVSEASDMLLELADHPGAAAEYGAMGRAVQRARFTPEEQARLTLEVYRKVMA